MSEIKGNKMMSEISLRKMVVLSIIFHAVLFALVTAIAGTGKTKAITVTPPHIKGYLINKPTTYGVKKRANALPAPIVEIEEKSAPKEYNLTKKIDDKKKALEKIKDELKKKTKIDESKNRQRAIKEVENIVKKKPRADNFALSNGKENSVDNSSEGQKEGDSVNEILSTYNSEITSIVESNWIPVNRKEIKKNPSLTIEIGIEIDKRGKLISLSVIQSSGIPSLDRSFLNAIKSSMPLPTPPKEIIDIIDETIFVIKFTGRDIIGLLE